MNKNVTLLPSNVRVESNKSILVYRISGKIKSYISNVLCGWEGSEPDPLGDGGVEELDFLLTFSVCTP